MVRWMVPLSAVVVVTVGLTVAAIELLPRTLFFPVIEFSAPTGLRVTFVQRGQTDRSGCEHVLGEVQLPVDTTCSGCMVVPRCTRGLSAVQGAAFSRAAITRPSARSGDGGLAIVFSAENPQVAMGACRQSEQLTASLPVELRLRCFAAGTPR